MFYLKKTKKNALKTLLTWALLLFNLSFCQAWWPQTEPHNSGINRTTHPAGLNYPSFNNFTDNVNPMSSYLNDERYFVVVRNYTNDGDYANNVYAEPGDYVLVAGFIHNNGYLNDPAVTATGVKAGMKEYVGGSMVSLSEENGSYFTSSGTEITVSEYVLSDNATPIWAWDEFTVTSETGVPIRLKATDVFYLKSDYSGTVYPGVSTTGLFWGGQSIGDPDSGYTSGTFKGCMENAMYTFVYFQVQGVATNPPTCTLTASPTAINPGSVSTLTWTSTGATSASLDQGINAVDLNDSTSVTPNSDTTYTLTVTWTWGTATCSATVTINTIPDLNLTKSVSAENNATTPPSGGLGTDVTYTINYLNEGSADATNTTIVDDYDETHLTNLRNITVPAGVTYDDTTVPGQITFNIGNLATGSGDSLTYEATIENNTPLNQDITNTATVTISETESDYTDNQDSATVQASSLQMGLSKSANPASVTNAQTVNFTITVTNNEATGKDITITDSYGLGGGSLNGTNGGSITLVSGSQNITFSGSGSATGDIASTGGVIITALGSGDSATITYQGTSSWTGIATNGNSSVTNTANLIYKSNTVYNASATVTITGPSGGGSSSSSSGGGGGSVYITTDPEIKKYVSQNGAKFYDADTSSDSMPLEKGVRNLVTYKVKVKNDSSMALENMTIEDKHIIRKSNIKRGTVSNVEWATYTDWVFTLEKIEKRDSAYFTYQVELDTSNIIPNASAYNEVTITDYERSRDVKGTKRTWQKDKAYIVMVEEVEEIDEPNEQMLRKYSNKQAIRDGEELIYTIFFKNIYEYDLMNVVLKDNYDETKLEIISAPGVNNGAALSFRRTIIRPGQTVMYRYTAKGINKTKEAVEATNYVKVTSDTVDLSKHHAEKTITIYPFDEPVILLKSGVTETSLILISLAGGMFYIHRRRLLRK